MPSYTREQRRKAVEECGGSITRSNVLEKKRAAATLRAKREGALN